MIGWEKRVLLRHYLARGLTKAVIAERLGINRRTINRWISKGDLELPLVELGPALALGGTSWDNFSFSIVDTAGSGLLNIWYGDPNGPEAAAHSHAPVKPFSELGLVGDGHGWRRSRDDRSSPGTRTGARALRLDGTPGQMDRPGLSPQRRLHPGAVDAVSGLPHRKDAPRRPCTHRTACGRRRERARYHRHQPRVPDLRAWDLYRPDSSESSS